MPYPCPEGRFRWAARIIIWELDQDFPEALTVGCALGAGEQDKELGQVIRDAGTARGGGKEVVWRKW